MKRKLKTWEQFEEEFKPYSFKWMNYNISGHSFIEYKNFSWFISSSMKKYFGEKIEIKKINKIHYTYKDKKLGFNWHELWFEPEFESIELISKEDFEV